MCSEHTCPLNRVSGLSFSVPGTHFSKLGANINPDLLKSYLTSRQDLSLPSVF